jgi:hypothetical protein
MLDLVACNLLIIDSKLGVTLSNFTEPVKTAFRQDVEGFHMAGEAQTLKKGNIAL